MSVITEDTKRRPFEAIANALRNSTRAARLESEEAAKFKAAADDDGKDEDKKKKDAKAEDGDEKAVTPKDEGDDEDNDEKPKAKKKADSGDDDDEKKDKKEAAATSISMDAADVAGVRAQERRRIAAILGSEVAAIVPHQALHIALKTDMSRDYAIAMLEAFAVDVPEQTTSNKADALRQRMADVRNPDLGVGDSQQDTRSTADSVAAEIIAAGKKRRGES